MTGRPGLRPRVVYALLAACSYLPILLTEPGRVSADTKSYLTIDPAALLAQAGSMWDPTVGAGTVPHQNIGYLFPLGPYYWFMDTVGVPDWLTQRLLWGTIVFAAAVGTYRLARWIGWTTTGAFVAAFAFAFTPYLLSYLARLSVMLGPWAAMPWMILLVGQAARTRSWRPAAWFAVVVALVGSVNASSLLFAGLAPLVWLGVDVASGRVRLADAVRAAARIGVLCIGVSIWWIVGLRVQGAYGIPILRYTETYESVASASTPAEILRGLGYWFLYGGDRLDSWVPPAVPYYNSPLVMTLGFVLVGVALLGFLVPFRGRAPSAGMLVLGLAVAVGGAPLDSPTPYGVLFEWFATETTAGFALRSTARAAPLVVLALAFGIASSTEWARSQLGQRDRPAAAQAVPIGVIVLLGLQMYPWFTAGALTPSLLRDEDIPAYQRELATWLDDNGDGRVWEIPATEFAQYRWGGTSDPVLPGIMDRPYFARDLILQGGPGTADLLNAFERRLPEGWFETESLAPVAARFGVETVVTRNDLEYERYRLARPGPLWADVTGELGAPDYAGPIVPDETVIPWVDERTLARPDAPDRFPAVAAFDLDPAPMVRSASTADPIVLAGSGDGLVDLAGSGLLAEDRVVLYASTIDDAADTGSLDPAVVGRDTWWVLSDTNRKQGRHWSTVGANLGALEAVGPLQLDPDPSNQPLDLFRTPPDDTDRQTIAVHTADIADVRASYYGNRIAYTLGDAPWFAFDGDPTTAWRAGVFDVTEGLVLEVDLAEEVTTPTISLLQPINGPTNRFITRARMTFDAGTDAERSVVLDLDERSRGGTGQLVDIPGGSFRTLRIEVVEDNLDVVDPRTLPGVGFAEVTIPGISDDRLVRVPSLDAFDVGPGLDAERQRLSYLLTRQRIDPATPNEASAEPFLLRSIDVPAPRSFTLTGEARIAAAASDAVLGDVLGDVVVAGSNRRLLGQPAARAASAFDGDLTTAWQTPFNESVGAEVRVEHPDAPIAVDSITVSWLVDDLHSEPTVLLVGSDEGDTRRIELPRSEPVDGVATAEIPIAGYGASVSRVTIEAIDETTSAEYFSGAPQVLPVGLAEIRFGDRPNPAVDPTTPLDATCRNDLLTLDGRAVPVRLDGTRGDAASRGELVLRSCGEPLDLDAGRHRIDATDGRTTGVDVDRLVLDAAALDEPAVPSTREVDVIEADDTHHVVSVAPGDPTWLVLAQSWNRGWTASVDGSDLGEPLLVDGFANGWIVPASDTTVEVTLEWTPQRSVRLALWASAISGIAVLVVLVLTRRDRRPSLEDRLAPPPSDDGETSARRSRSPVVLAVLGVAGLAMVAGPVPALVGVAVAAAGSRWRWLPGAVIVAAGAIAGGAIVVLEWRYDYPPGVDWPSRFGWTGPLVWLGVAIAASTAAMPSGLRARR